jgi:hypothetical protein
MVDRRVGLRLLCADIVEIHGKNDKGYNRRQTANLEDISAMGACLQAEHALPFCTTISICHERRELTGQVKYCILRDNAHLLGIEFEPDRRTAPGRVTC